MAFSKPNPLTRSYILCTALSAIAFLSTINFALAQNDWQEGYIITNERDTIHGYIDYRNSKSNAKQCFFKKDLNSEEQFYNPEDLWGYRYNNGKFYISKTIKTGDNTFKQMFLEYLINGEVSVFYLKDEKDQYFAEKEGEMVELKNTEELVSRNGTNYMKERNEFKGMLSYLFSDANMSEEVQRSRLDHRSLIRLSKKYHETVCDEYECIVYEKSVKPVRVLFGITGGTNFNSVFLDQQLFYEVRNQSSYYGGLVFNIQNIPMIYERVSLQIEVVRSSIYYRENKRNALNVPIIIDYRLTANKLYPKLEAGLSSHFVSNADVKARHMALLLGAGLNYEYSKRGRIFVNGRFETGPKIFRVGAGVLF